MKPEEQPRRRPDIMGSNPNLQGIGTGNLPDVFSSHRHAGGPGDGQFLFGPYFIFDTNGKKRKLTVDGSGVATWDLV